jgi:hypothetical protein
LSYRGGNLQPAWYGPEQAKVGNHSEPALFVVTDESAAWKTYSATVETPAEANELLLYLRVYGSGEGRAAYFDDIKVELVP